MVRLLFMAFTRNAIRKVTSRKLAGFALLSAILVLSIAVPPFHDRRLTVCLFENLFGIPCPGCGMTRAFLYLGHGDIESALQLNVNSPAAFLTAVVLWMQFAFSVIARTEIRIHLAPGEKYFIAIVAVTVLMSGWIYNLSRHPWV
jgi:hypothetical protein